MNSAGGQFSSARDLAKVMRMFLDPSKKDSLVSPLVVREWLRPMHAWSDEINEVGMPWEIIKLPDSNGRPQRWYRKGPLTNIAGQICLIDMFRWRTVHVSFPILIQSRNLIWSHRSPQWSIR